MRRRFVAGAYLALAFSAAAATVLTAAPNVSFAASVQPRVALKRVAEKSAAAEARAGRGVSLPTTGFHVQATNGYEMFVTGFPKGVFGSDPVVAVQVKAAGNLAGYLVKGTVGRRRIAADFPNLGSIDVRFHPSGETGRRFPWGASVGTWRCP
jgi:hypothetical protein